MTENIVFAGIIYLSVISLPAIILTCIDKYKAVNNKWRIPEKTLMILGFLGGAAAEYITMKIIRHKTRHNKFMIGLPIFILLHILILIIFFYMTK